MRKSKFYLASRLTEDQRKDIQAAGLAYFPVLFGESQGKYSEFVLWMASTHKVVSPSTRDLFTAGGRSNLYIGDATFKRVPRVLISAYDHRKALVAHILAAKESDLCRYWGEEIKEDRLAQWVSCVCRASRVGGLREILETILEDALKRIAEDETLEKGD